eukprot:CAMPEP_0182567214 /NCGR_PEP_ID=MMETSP1324-20130603/8493_1 /TAXON_ID=236786 /ORGANISM="Florenciella sp., Strain RCC1587" /LENGTH=285 /DNA_ID=CAMNT_0024781169 /DNA_START=84 /DNA_END=942 /DNA_ORIENTATION=-
MKRRAAAGLIALGLNVMAASGFPALDGGGTGRGGTSRKLLFGQSPTDTTDDGDDEPESCGAGSTYESWTCTDEDVDGSTWIRTYYSDSTCNSACTTSDGTSSISAMDLGFGSALACLDMGGGVYMRAVASASTDSSSTTCYQELYMTSDCSGDPFLTNDISACIEADNVAECSDHGLSDEFESCTSDDTCECCTSEGSCGECIGSHACIVTDGVGACKACSDLFNNETDIETCENSVAQGFISSDGESYDNTCSFADEHRRASLGGSPPDCSHAWSVGYDLRVGD